jgi:hypothetical protein
MRALSRFCLVCALPLPAIPSYLLLRLTQSSFGGFAMKYLSLVLVLCGMASLAAAPARAFDVQGQNANLQDGVNQFSSPADPFLNPDFTKGSSLALPYIGSADSGFISDYGNSIPIPAPGIDRGAPAWYFPR